MTTIETVVGGLLAGVISIFFWMFKRGHRRMDNLDKRIRKAISEPEARLLIADKLEPLRQQHVELNHRIGRLEGKIDKLIDIVLKIKS